MNETSSIFGPCHAEDPRTTVQLLISPHAWGQGKGKWANHNLLSYLSDVSCVKNDQFSCRNSYVNNWPMNGSDVIFKLTSCPPVPQSRAGNVLTITWLDKTLYKAELGPDVLLPRSFQQLTWGSVTYTVLFPSWRKILSSSFGRRLISVVRLPVVLVQKLQQKVKLRVFSLHRLVRISAE